MRHVLFVFLDGVGLGPADPAVNPLAHARPAWDRLAGGRTWTGDASVVDAPEHVFRPLDANLSLTGLPQSGTGQASLFTGVNCARLAGRHFGPFPHSQTRAALAARNVFRQVAGLGLPLAPAAAFANAYPPRFFEVMGRRDRWTVTTRACLDAGLAIRTLDDLRRGDAVAADLTGQGLRDLGLDVTPQTPADTARRLHALARGHHFTLFEHFFTDKVGHRRDADAAAVLLDAFDAFFAALLDVLDPERDLLVVSSDHGNLEDLSVKTHTRHPVPLVAYGRGAHHFRACQSIVDVTPAVVAALRSDAAE